ncbi:hypothetical protein NPIL_230281, partial [Nephila pilipes]
MRRFRHCSGPCIGTYSGPQERDVGCGFQLAAFKWGLGRKSPAEEIHGEYLC